MNSAEAEAASSLFGTDESASDLFASLGADTAAQGVFDTSSDDQFSNSSAFDVFPPANSQAGDNNSWPESFQHSSQQPSSYQPTPVSTGGAYPLPTVPAQLSNTPTQQHEPQPPEVQKTTQDATFETYTSPNGHAPYAPAPATHSVPANPPVQPAYNPYAPPAVTQSYAAPPVAPATPSQSAYSPYAPPATPSQSTYSPYAPPTPSATSAYPAPYSSSVGSTPYGAKKIAVVPPPPAPAPVLNRPKLANAYDPPIPASRPSRRGVSGSARPISAYGSYSQAPAPVPPPPLPAGGQFTPSGYALPPPSSSWTGRSDAECSGDPPSTVLWFQYSERRTSAPATPTTQLSLYAGWRDAAAKLPSLIHFRAPTWVCPFNRSRTLLVSRQNRTVFVSCEKYGSPVPCKFAFLTNERSSSPGSFSTRSNESAVGGSSSSLTGAPERIASPASAHSLDRTRSPPTLSANPYLPNAATHRVPSPLRKSTVNSYNPPNPSLVTNGHGAEAAGQNLPPPPNGLHASQSQYQPGAKPPSLARNRSASSGSVYSATSSSPDQPYAPSLYGHGTQKRSETDYGNYTSRYNYNAPGETSPYDQQAQEIIIKPIHATAYAPSPSLLGANDPLGRTSSRAPVFSFGFGGKFLTCFHGASVNTGFDVALSSRNSTGITVRQLNKIIPQSALEVSAATFPGPLFSDPGTPTTGLGIGYLHAGSAEGRSAEGKLVLVKLLKVLVENDGKLSGTPQIDIAVRAALVPKLDATSSSSDDLQAPGFSSVSADPLTMPYPTLAASELSEAPIATSTLRPSALDKIQDFLVRGERRKAYHYALDEKLWAHAMLIASSIDRDAWKETVNEFFEN
ncbi:Protein transport protein sec16 [Mycena sanguinolenta]|uniref:Protein transport protein sec16 n=1 Tax=Mycena sanguinolenta TaxID=230812 RepID=A0A8H7D5X5_9AGAR|nr:Protein transport protein sec16 [Mycena sanguinolenta]